MKKFWAAYIFTMIASMALLLLFYQSDGFSLSYRIVLAAVLIFAMIVYTYVVYRFGKGIDRVNGQTNIPTLSGRVVLAPENIDFLEVSKWMIGRAFDFSHVKIVMKDGTVISFILPDAALREARLN